jgi:adenylate kinase family enzyme
MLTAVDVLDPVPRRVLIAGVTGAGKTTLARRVSEILGVPRTELDSLYHGAGWVPRPSFVEDVEAFSAEPAWVSEWQYRAVRSLLASRADTLVWLDLPPRVPLWRVFRRTLVRRVRRTVLWNENLEPPLHTIVGNPDHILRWAVRTRHSMPEEVLPLEREQPHLRVVHLRSRREVDAWLVRLAESARGSAPSTD